MAKKETVEVKELAARIAKAKGIDADKAGKLLRSRIRGNFDTLATKAAWPALVTQGKANKDGNRYPAMPAATAEALFKAMTKGTPIADALKAGRSRKVTTPEPTPQVEA
jgi:uncharacterized protein with WD repeat